MIYFVTTGWDEPIKIGFARNTSQRISNLQTAHWTALELLAEVRGSQVTERFYHALFAEDRIRGEWFLPSPSVKAEVEWLSEGNGPSTQDSSGPNHAKWLRLLRNPEEYLRNAAASLANYFGDPELVPVLLERNLPLVGHLHRHI